MIDVETYSPYLDRYLDTPDHEFQLVYDPANPKVDFAQVDGRLIDVLDGEGIPGVRIDTTRADGSFFGSVWTDQHGRFQLKAPVGTYTLNARTEGFRPIEHRLQLDRAGRSLVDVEAIPLTYARIRVQGREARGGWTDWFSGPVEIAVEVGPEELLDGARARLSRVIQGEVFEVGDLYRGRSSPAPMIIDTVELEDGTYEIAVDTLSVDGAAVVSTARFGVRNWHILTDELLPPLPAGWLGLQSRKKTIAESDGWVYDVGAPDLYFGDEDRLVRERDAPEWLIWKASKLHEYEVAFYVKGRAAVRDRVVIDVSADGEDWTELAFTERRVAASPDGWSKVIVAGDLPDGVEAELFRMTLLPGGGDERELQIGRVELRSFLAR